MDHKIKIIKIQINQWSIWIKNHLNTYLLSITVKIIIYNNLYLLYNHNQIILINYKLNKVTSKCLIKVNLQFNLLINNSNNNNNNNHNNNHNNNNNNNNNNNHYNNKIKILIKKSLWLLLIINNNHC